MQIRESELALLNAIHGLNGITGKDLVSEMATLFSKQHVYVLLSSLEGSSLVQGQYEATGKRGPPQRRYQLTPVGTRVRTAANKLANELKKAGRPPDVIWGSSPVTTAV